jgi:hypothetical protein
MFVYDQIQALTANRYMDAKPMVIVVSVPLSAKFWRMDKMHHLSGVARHLRLTLVLEAQNVRDIPPAVRINMKDIVFRTHPKQPERFARDVCLCFLSPWVNASEIDPSYEWIVVADYGENLRVYRKETGRFTKRALK